MRLQRQLGIDALDERRHQVRRASTSATSLRMRDLGARTAGTRRCRRVHHIGTTASCAARARGRARRMLEAALGEGLRLVEVVDVDGDGAVVAGLGRPGARRVGQLRHRVRRQDLEERARRAGGDARLVLVERAVVALGGHAAQLGLARRAVAEAELAVLVEAQLAASGASSSSCISMALYGQAVAHSVQPVQASSLMSTSLRSRIERDRVEVAGVDAALIGAGVASVDEVEVAEDAPVDGQALDAVALLARLLAAPCTRCRRRSCARASVIDTDRPWRMKKSATAALAPSVASTLARAACRGAAEAIGHERIDALPQVDAPALDRDHHRAGVAV